MFAPEHIEQSPFSETGGGKARKLLLTLTTSAFVVAGATAPLFFGTAYTLRHSVETTLRIDAPGLSSGERHQALLDAGKALRSTSNLDDMVRMLDLARDEEFGVAAPSALGVVADIVTGKAMTVSVADARLRERLSGAFTTNPDAAGKRVAISVVSEDAGRSARIARAVAESYQRELSGAAVRSARTQASGLERAMQDAENAVSDALAKSGNQGALRRSEEERQMLAQEISMLEASVARLRDDVKTVSETSPAEVLSKPLSSAFDFSGIDQMRQVHVDAKMLVDQLSASLGPRHPRLLAAQAALAETRGKIDAALMRLSASLKQQEATATKELAELKARQQKIAAAPASPEAKALSDLQAKADKAKQDYLSAAQRLDAAAVSGPITATTVNAASPTSAKAVGWPMWMLSGVGALLGLGFGLTLALVMMRRPEEDVLGEAALAADHEIDLFEDEEIDLLEPLDVAVSQELPDQPAFAAATRPTRIYEAAAEPHLEDDVQVQEQFDDYPLAANSVTPLADRVRELLLANRMREEEAEAHLPPLVAAVMGGGIAVAPHYDGEAEEEARKTAALRQDIMSLRERVVEFNERRTAGQR